MWSGNVWCALIFGLRTCEGRSVKRFSLTKKVICDRAFLPAKSQHFVAGYQGNMGQSTHHRLDRLQIVSVGSLRDQSTTQFHRWRSKNKILSCEVITRMLLGRIIRGHSCGGHHVLTCVPLNGIQVKTSLVIDSPSISSRRGHSSYDIVDTKTIWFVFLLILPCWRVFFLGSPALHYAGADRLQMVGVRSLHVDRSWLLDSSLFIVWKSSTHCSTSDSSWSTP